MPTPPEVCTTGRNIVHDVFTYTLLAIFNSFNYADAIGTDDNKRAQNAVKVEATRTRWLDGKARVGYSNDGTPIVYHIPGAISKPVHVCLFTGSSARPF